MYIGEVSKPTVERTELKKKQGIPATAAVEPTKAVGDLVKLSDESKEQYEKDQEEHKKNKNKEKDPSSKLPPLAKNLLQEQGSFNDEDADKIHLDLKA